MNEQGPQLRHQQRQLLRHHGREVVGSLAAEMGVVEGQRRLRRASTMGLSFTSVDGGLTFAPRADLDFRFSLVLSGTGEE